MVNTSKILTVSYGTFSCTLEGFDDSFDMMKAIAEYFRDLAQDDRYFGAEPPTPDAEMLARIAEREVSRRVEAREERGAIVLRPSTEEAAPPAMEPAAQTAPQQPTEPAPVEAPVMAAPVAQEPEQELPPVSEPAHELEEPAAEAPVEEPIEEPQAMLTEAEDMPPAQTSEDSIAAKLSRIRAVVSRGPQEQPELEPDYSEDEHAEEASDDTAASIAAALRDDSPIEMDLDEDEAEDAMADFEAEFDEDEEQGEDTPQDPQLAEDIAEASDEPEFEDETLSQNIRVLRMKRDAFETSVAEGQLEASAPDGLSAEDEADLLKELAEVEAELNLASDEDDAFDSDEDADDLTSIFAEDEDEDELQAEAEAEQVQPAASSKGDTDVSRLMDKAEEEMERPEGAHRRSAIAHLRAAVQATRAETEAGGGLNRSDDSVSAYRDDLNRVVRPRRPRPSEDETNHARRPQAKPAPLKLVAEQRIDAPAAEQAQVVRPRRVSVTDIQEDAAPNLAADAASFVDYAQKVGVKDLAELMEAAAAYMSYVEGRQKFSRPQLMNKARQVEEYTFSREDGLRSFGQLLRQGKIEKLKGGRFTVSDDLIGFKPDGDRAVG